MGIGACWILPWITVFNPRRRSRVLSTGFLEHSPAWRAKNEFIDARVMLPPCSREQLIYYREYGIPEAQQCKLPQMLLSGFVVDADLTPELVGRMIAQFRAADPVVREIFWVRTALTGPLDSQFTNFAGIVTPDWTEIPREHYAKTVAGRAVRVFPPAGALWRTWTTCATIYIIPGWRIRPRKRIFNLKICRLSFEEGSWSAQLILCRYLTFPQPLF